MEASKENPIYTVYCTSSGTKYNLTDVTESISFSDQQSQMAKTANINLANIKVGSSWLSKLLKVRDRVFIYADDGETKKEVFRGFIWTRSYKSALDERSLTLKCYDNLIYLQESEESEYFVKGKSTEDILKYLCNKWGIQLEYSYQSITHAKLALRGNLSDIITEDLLNLVRDRTGKKYVILSEQDKMQIKEIGSNSTVYTIKAGENALGTSSQCTMDGMVTKVVILGSAGDDEREPVEATVNGDTSTYGTLQKLIDRDENTPLAEAKKEAQSIIDENGKPFWEYGIEAPDIPWVRKGDKIKAEAGDLTATYIVVGIDREISNTKKTMTLTMEPV